jgi:two-component system response regulator PilR (NtrC family)
LSGGDNTKGNKVQTAGGEWNTHVLIGDSQAVRQLRADIKNAARSQAKVLILGETGAGKEVASRLIHALGARKYQPFVAMNCSGVPDTLLESELFGHVRGSFTGAFRDKPGLAKTAEGGTLLLDEVGEMSLRMQAVALRFVETGEVQPIGACAHGRVDVRLIAATNRDLRAQIAQREFREDLFYRLNVIQISVPPLRERARDIGALLRHFLSAGSEAHGVPRPSLTPEAEAVLCAYRWPGNVRELKNVTERLVVRLNGQPIRDRDLPEEVLAESRAVSAPAAPRGAAAAVEISPTSPIVDEAWSRIVNGESFWTAAHARFKAHDMTRADLRVLIHRGLERTRGNYRQLVELFHMESSDYRRFLSFLYQYDCNLPFQTLRNGAALAATPADELERRDVRT